MHNKMSNQLDSPRFIGSISDIRGLYRSAHREVTPDTNKEVGA